MRTVIRISKFRHGLFRITIRKDSYNSERFEINTRTLNVRAVTILWKEKSRFKARSLYFRNASFTLFWNVFATRRDTSFLENAVRKCRKILLATESAMYLKNQACPLHRPPKTWCAIFPRHFVEFWDTRLARQKFEES